MYFLEEPADTAVGDTTVSVSLAARAEAHLYASKDRSVYIGRIELHLNIKKASSVLIVALKGEFSIENCQPFNFSPSELDLTGRIKTKSVLIPAETMVSIDTGNVPIGIYFLDYLGRDVHALSQNAQSVTLRADEQVYINLRQQDAFIERLSYIYRHKPPGRNVIGLLTDLYPSTGNELGVDSRIEKVIEYIQCGGGLNRELPDLASYVNLSVPRFAQLFKQTTGTNVRRFKLWCRLYLITENLSKGMTFSEAAHAAGYSDYGHFSRSFLEMSGVNPSIMFYRAKNLHLDVFQAQ